MRIFRALAAVFLSAALAAPVAAQQVSANALAKLEERRDKNPTNRDALRALGIAYYKLNRYQDAMNVLQEARQRDNRDGVTALYLGLSAEGLGNLAAARDAYTSYLAVGRSRSARNDVTKRLAAVTRLELASSARAAVAREQELAATPGAPNTVAVLPFNYSGDPTYAPIARGLADLMVTDLGIMGSDTLRLVERTRIQAILDEIALSQSGNVNQATAVRSGRLVQARKIVIGSVNLTPQSLTVVAPHVDVAGSGQPVGNASETGTLNQLFDLQKQLVLEVLTDLGIVPSPRQIVAINRRPTQNLQAFLAYSRGLVASDAGRLDEAATFFDNARALDPGFGAAAAAAIDARAAIDGQAVTPGAIENDLQGRESQIVSSAERGSVAINDALGTTLGNALADVNPSTADMIARPSTSASTRDASTSTTTADQTIRTGTVIIIIRLP